MAERNARSRLDPAIPLTAAGAIFGALVGTTLLDVSNSEHAMRIVDYTTQALWIPVFLLFALLAAWSDWTWLRYSAWILAGTVAFVTAGVIFFTSLGFTRDVDHVLLRVDDTTRTALAHLCGKKAFTSHQIKGIVHTHSLGSDFVIFDFKGGTGGTCQTIDIPRSGVLAFQELH